MSMTHEEAVQLLCSMFESWDRETLMAIFESNGYHVERTIESIIGMEQPELVNNPPVEQSQNTTPDTYNHHAHSEPPRDMMFDSNFDSQTQHPSSSSSTQGKQRGAPVQLPPDFLRLPKQNKDQAFLADEQLALMLQNELFQEQVDQLLGNEFREGLRRQQVQGHGQRDRQSNPGQRPGQGGTENSGDIMGIPDMGILTGIKNMGEGMKKQLNQLALNFNNKGNTSSKSHRLDEESRPLTAVDYEEEDEEEEDYGNYNNSSLRQRNKKND